MESSAIDVNLHSSQEKKNIKLIPINPAVCFATTSSRSTINNSNGPIFVPVINISGKKYLPVYFKKSLDDNNQIDQSDKISFQLISNNSIISSKHKRTIIEENDVETQSFPLPPSPKPTLYVKRLSISQIHSVDNKQQQQQISKEHSTTNNKQYIKVPSHIFTRRSPEGHKNLRAKTVRIGKIRWPPALNPDEIDNGNQQRQILVRRRIQEEIHRNEIIIEQKESSSTLTLSDDGDDISTDEIVARNQLCQLDIHRTKALMVGKENFEHIDESSFLVGKLINYFETFINDLNKDFSHNSKFKSTSDLNQQQQLHTTSQNTSNLTVSYTDAIQPQLPTIIDEDINQTIRYRTFSEDIYDRLTYQTLINTDSYSIPNYSSHEQLTQSSIISTKRQRRRLNHNTNKKRLHRRRPPTYIKELKAYLAHRESSVTEIVKIRDVKKFSNVLVWLSNQTTSPSLIETSTPISLIKTDTTNHSPSVTTDSVIAITQEISQSYSDPVPPFTDGANTSKSSSSRQSFTYLTYDSIPWKLKIRKEVFSPAETFDQPLLIELLYLQIVHDTFSSICVRISEAERTNMKTFLSSHGIATMNDISLIKQASAKKMIIEQARQWPTYFCRLFPVSMPKSHSGEVQMLGVSHSGIRLIKRSRTMTSEDTLQVLETFSFDIIQHVSSIRNGSTIDLRLAKKVITVHSHRIQKIKQIIDKFLKEFRIDPSKQSRVSDQNHQHEKLTPLPLSNTSDLFKSSSQASLMSCSQTFSELIPSASLDTHTSKPTQNDIVFPTISTLPIGHSMMEFALQNFKVPNRRRSKKSWKTSEWTWQDYTELIKWSKNPISLPLLRQSSNDSNRIARQCFLSIMRFMGDHAMARGQTDIDCLFHLLKTMHKHRTLIDEILCQIMKQLTDNKSLKTDSVQCGWKLLAIILNYFIPSEHLRPYFVKYLNDNINQNERLVKLCLNHYEQTLKYGGRKNTPSKAEIDLLIANGRNGGKRQTFLLPGGIPLTLLSTPSMVIDDCLNLLCERLNISNALENDEYSIFIISASEHSSRLLNPTEYLFDILSECVRSNILDYHLIIKRMLWFTIPFALNDNNKTEIFMDFMYYQLLPELLEGTMIVLNNNHLSNELTQEISLMAALQYRASNKTGLPSMREVKHLLPATVLKLKSIRPQEWTAIVHDKLFSFVQSMTIIEAKMKFLTIIQTWPLFGITFFAVESVDDPTIQSPCLIGISKNGILFLDLDTRETIFIILYNDVVSIRHHQNTIDITYGSLNQPYNLQCQVDRAQDLVALSGRYLSFIGRTLTSALERKSDTQLIHMSSTSVYNDPISIIL